MSYVTNPHAPKARGDAVRLVKLHGWSQSKVARHIGVSQGTVSKWIKKAPNDLRKNIPTLSSRPKYSPNALDLRIVRRIIVLRRKHKRCAPVIHQYLLNEGVRVSLSSVERTLRRHGLTRKKSKWARKRVFIPRPLIYAPGDLIEVDTIHFVNPHTQERYYIYTLIDLCTRKAYVKYSKRINQRLSLDFVLEAQRYMGFKFKTIQTDNGSEFSKWFGDRLRCKNINLRHSRVRRSNDQAHIERFNRTLQDECTGTYPKPKDLSRLLSNYLDYYNKDRLHLSLGLTTPQKVLQSYSKVLM
jgi:transposase InsO family protein